MNDETRRQLEAAGRRPVPPPSAGYTDALEERLVALARERKPERERDIAPQAWWRRPPMRLAAGFAAVVLAVALVLGNGLGGDRTTLAFELTGTVNVEVALTDGTTLVDPDGLLLPEGAVVRVGADGSARIGAVALGAGDSATVVAGRLQVDRRPDGQLPGDSARPSRTDRPTALATDAPTRPPVDPTESPTPQPTQTRPPDPTPTPRPVRTGSPEPSPAPTKRPTPTPAPAVDGPRLKLDARAIGPHEIAATWSAAPDARRYVLVATGSRDGHAPNPVYPGSRIVGEFTRPPATPLVFRVGESLVEVRLLVVALTEDGAILARSPIATVALGG